VPLTVTIITHNAAAVLEDCLESASFADEILVVDSESTDQTVAIATRHGERILREAWRGFGPQKQFGVDAASNDWVLCLDADERVSDGLRESILLALRAPRATAYRMARCNRFLGRWLRHGEGYPDWCLRLFDRRQARWSEDTVHEKVITTGAVEDLAGDLLHLSAESLPLYLEKQNRYTSLQAETMHAAGRTAGAAHLVIAPLARFIKFYFFRLGFVDGLPGLVHVAIGCMNSFNKYAKLIALQRGSQQ
jgi:glycosyltransferase involved in cell wall biosynthesis